MMSLIKETFPWAEFEWDLFIWTPEFYLVCTFLVLVSLGYVGTYLMTDQEDE